MFRCKDISEIIIKYFEEDNRFGGFLRSDEWSTIADVSSLNLNYRRASGISPCTLTAAANSALFVDSTRWKRRQKRREVMQKKKVQSTRRK